MATYTQETLSPKLLKISRNVYRFSCSWTKRGPNYGGGQQFQYRTNLDAADTWHSLSVSNSATSINVELRERDYEPYTNKKLTRFYFRVRGKRQTETSDDDTTNYNWSEWKQKAYGLIYETVTTKAPSGLSVARDGMKFACTWKITDENYSEGQNFQYKTNLDADWKSVGVYDDTTAKTVKLTASDYFPTTSDKLQSFSFRVRGQREDYITGDVNFECKASAWVTKTYTVNLPYQPTLEAELQELDNVSTFTWTTEHESDDSRPTVDVHWQTMRIKNCTETNGANLRWDNTQPGWSSGTGALDNSENPKRIEEDSTVLADGSYTRWVRVRSRGSRGASAWRYAKHVYARPYKAVIKSVGSVAKDGVTTVRVEWTSQTNAAHPIDQSIVHYKIAVPTADMGCPAGDDWTEAAIISDTAGTDAARFYVDDTTGADRCMWVRIVNKHDHDTNDIASTPEYVRGKILSTPEINSATFNVSNHSVTINATNNSDVPDSKLAVVFRTATKAYTVGIIDVHGGSAGTITAVCPNFTNTNDVGAEVYAFQGSYTSQTKSGVTTYTIDENMKSEKAQTEVSIPVAPSAITVTTSKLLTAADVKWRWTWTAADMAEISWSERENAWTSTNQPSTYVVDDNSFAKWRVSGLTPGNTYYFRVRLGRNTDDGTQWGPYSETAEVGFYTKPAIPVLQLSHAIVDKGGTFTASWTYSCSDGMPQTEAKVAVIPSTVTNPAQFDKYVVGRTKNAKAINITADWAAGQERMVRVMTFSKGEQASEWSEPVPIAIPAQLTCTIESTSLQTITVMDPDGESRSVRALLGLPFNITVSGAPAGGTTTIIIEREEEYKMERPDGTTIDGYAGEAVVIYKQAGDDPITIKRKDLIGRLDDGAKYLLTAIVSADDHYISAQRRRHFEVHWDHQAHRPLLADVELLPGNAMKITPHSNYVIQSTVCDIYRLSTDKPELIVEDGKFDTEYVDPYPTIGETGGYRVVYKNAYGDYITEKNNPAWKDTKASIDEFNIIIDFNGRQAILPYNIQLSSQWSKAFTLTNYLGGAQQGDWTNTSTRRASYNVTLLADDTDMIRTMRELSDWTGICHIRTPEGSSYACNIDVSETKDSKAWDEITYTLNVTRVDPETLDGMTYEEWLAG